MRVERHGGRIVVWLPVVPSLADLDTVHSLAATPSSPIVLVTSPLGAPSIEERVLRSGGCVVSPGVVYGGREEALFPLFRAACLGLAVPAFGKIPVVHHEDLERVVTRIGTTTTNNNDNNDNKGRRVRAAEKELVDLRELAERWAPGAMPLSVEERVEWAARWPSSAALETEGEPGDLDARFDGNLDAFRAAHNFRSLRVAVLGPPEKTALVARGVGLPIVADRPTRSLARRLRCGGFVVEAHSPDQFRALCVQDDVLDDLTHVLAVADDHLRSLDWGAVPADPPATLDTSDFGSARLVLLEEEEEELTDDIRRDCGFAVPSSSLKEEEECVVPSLEAPAPAVSPVKPPPPAVAGRFDDLTKDEFDDLHAHSAPLRQFLLETVMRPLTRAMLEASASPPHTDKVALLAEILAREADREEARATALAYLRFRGSLARLDELRAFEAEEDAREEAEQFFKPIAHLCRRRRF